MSPVRLLETEGGGEGMSRWLEFGINQERTEKTRWSIGCWQALHRSIDPKLALDNNATERALRAFVIGRKNHALTLCGPGLST